MTYQDDIKEAEARGRAQLIAELTDKADEKSGAGLTFAELKDMTPEQINAQWDEVQKVMTKGPQGDPVEEPDQEQKDEDDAAYRSLTMKDLKAGRYSDAELIERKDEVDALLRASGS